ncbi:MAG TPA: hotdog fold thioesterase [Caulobacteraceae bacterium]|nr:hotdog fold thioesterase [Caulobacteraceae bacterium]
MQDEGVRMGIWRDAVLDVTALNAMQAGTMAAFLGIEFMGSGEDWLQARMPVDHRTHQPFGRLHGGASVALAETVGSVAASMTLDPAVSVGVGMEINANHIRPVKDGFVIATATPEARGRTTQVWSIRITDERDRLVCICRLTVAVIPATRA